MSEADRTFRIKAEETTAPTEALAARAPAQLAPHDRVADAYFGAMGESFMRQTQTRIHWICRRVSGSRVLDVGCSQGITALLLGREGKSVLGIDVDAAAIERANEYLAREDVEVRRNVAYVRSDATTYDFGDLRFDTVIATEVLEHLVQPERIVALAAERLVRHGRFLVTVPFGINDFFDHKSTYYLQEPYELVAQRFDVEEVVVLDHWLGIVARKRQTARRPGARVPIGPELIGTLERGVLRLERSLRGELDGARARLSEGSQKYRSATEQIASMKQQLAQVEASHRAQRELANAKDSELQAFLKERKQLEQAMAALRTQLEEANGKYRTATEQSSAVRADRDRAVAAQAELRATVEALTQRQLEREGEAARFDAEVQSLRAELAASARARDTAEAALAAAMQDGADMMRRLDLALREGEALRRDLAESVRAARRGTVRIEQLQAASRSMADALDQARTRAATIEASREALAAHHETLRARDESREQRLAALADEVRALETALSERDERIRQLSARVDEAAQASTTADETRSTLTDELERARRDVAERDATLAQLRGDLLRQRIAATEANAKAEQHRHQAVEAKRKQAKTRATLSFQLGHALIHATKSWPAARRLPGTLLALRREAKRRRTEHDVPPAVDTPAPSAPSAQHPLEGLPSRAPRTEGAKRLATLRVAAICDDFTRASFAPECDLLELTPAGWRAELEAVRPALLFIESAWRGKDDLWGNRVGHRSSEVVGAVEWCRARGVPTVFWNKEDPVHFETFLNTAKLFDVVFTTDIDCIHRYKRALGHERVHLLPFACQPRLHNPVESFERKDAFAFAGAYYAKYPERTRDLATFIATLPAFRPVEIYDRNFGKTDANYQFPEEYRPFIVGNLPFEQIDRAYKGYRYAINLNSIKQSQSMFARRVFELLACNTLTVSNFSRGLRLFFGDLVPSSDDGDELLRQLRAIDGVDRRMNKWRLAALRKVMAEHTYQDRLAYVAQKALGHAPAALLPFLVVVAHARDDGQLQALKRNFERQRYARKALVLVLAPGFEPANDRDDDAVRVVSSARAATIRMEELGAATDWIAGMVADDYYGPRYLEDLALASRYTDVATLGKSAHFVRSPTSGVALAGDGTQYRAADHLSARSSAVRIEALDTDLRTWAANLYTATLERPGFAIDEFNYCRNAGTAVFDAAEIVDDLTDVDTGLDAATLIAQSERASPSDPAPAGREGRTLPDLPALFRQAKHSGAVTLEADGKGLRLLSSLADGTHEYVYAARDLRPAELGAQGPAVDLHLAVDPGLNVQLVLLFLDRSQRRIGHRNLGANRNHTVDMPKGTAGIRLGLRLYGAGSARVDDLLLGHVDLEPPVLVTRGRHLVLTNHYPAQGDLYRNAFVHRRVLAYRRHGHDVDVFRLRPDETLSFHEFEGVDCVTGSEKALRRLLDSGRYASVLVHFLDERTWQTLRDYADRTRIVVWVHGADIQPFHRREHNFGNPGEQAAARERSRERCRFWKALLGALPERMHVVFVSRHFADEAMADLNLTLPPDRYSVIPNPIDTDLFQYSPKPSSLRTQILSVRPYSSATYANDLTVKAILELSKRPFFESLAFRLVGDGALFDETVEPLRTFRNVTLDKRFLSQSEIAKLHRAYGVFLCPSRMDTHGVSRDEAMASGLVPVTSAVGAIPEFVDERCGMLAPPEDHLAIAAAIERLYASPELFESLSRAAHARVAATTASSLIVARELALFATNGNQSPGAASAREAT